MQLKREAKLLFLFLGAAIALRFFSFFISVLDHDESTYMIIGRDILQGKLLYTDITDSKPIGIFFIYAFSEIIGGNSIWFKRLLAAIVVGLTAFLIYRFSNKLFLNRKSAIAGGFVYLLFVSTWPSFGLSPNTELYFNFFTIAAVLFLFKRNTLSFFIGGLLFGIGFIIKYLVLFDFVAITSFLFILEFIQSGRKLSLKRIILYVFSGVGFSIPFILVNLWFLYNNNFSDFYFITYELPGRYGDQSNFFAYIKLLFEFIGRFLPFSILFLYMIFSKNNFDARWKKWLLIIWVLSILLAIYLPGKAFRHYTIQLMLPLSIMSGLFIHTELKKTRFSEAIINKKIGIAILVLYIITIQFFSVKDNYLAIDHYKEISEYIKEDLNDKDFVFASNDGHIIYYLLEKESPTKYIHSSILSSDLSKSFGVDREKEIKDIIHKKPKYVLVKKPFAKVQGLLKKYNLVKTFKNGKILLYKRNEKSIGYKALN